MLKKFGLSAEQTSQLDAFSGALQPVALRAADAPPDPLSMFTDEAENHFEQDL